MKNIRMMGYCPVCKRFRQPKCQHNIPARYYFIDVKHEGLRIVRGTDLDGRTLRTLDDAVALRQKLLSEIQNKTLNIGKWTTKTKPDFLFQNLCNKWFDEKKREVEQRRLKPGYIVKLRQYIIHYYGYFTNQDIRSIFNTKDFALQLPDALSVKYQKNIVDALKNFFHWCKDNRYISEMPVFPKISVPEHRPKTLSIELRLSILAYIPDEHKPIFIFLFYQGARPSEVRALKWDCIENDRVIYKRTFSNEILWETTKEGNIRENLIFPEVMAILPKRTFPLDFVFRHGKKLKRHYSKTYLNDIFKEASKKAGIDISLYEATKHSFGTSWRQAGMPLEALQGWFGHKSIKTTEIYSKADVVETFKKVGRI
uniref:Putative site-specific tyrosine recombinase n=1 Tax=viral metagenome TaxID=1070528 RepID=A0A6H1Z8Z4_9ZZZZ